MVDYAERLSQFTRNLDATGEVEGLPAGGSTGEVLTKQSATDFDTDWDTGGGGGLSQAQVLARGLGS